MYKKANSFISKSQGLYDKINAMPGLVSNSVKQMIDETLNKGQLITEDKEILQDSPKAPNGVS